MVVVVANRNRETLRLFYPLRDLQLFRRDRRTPLPTPFPRNPLSLGSRSCAKKKLFPTCEAYLLVPDPSLPLSLPLSPSLCVSSFAFSFALLSIEQLSTLSLSLTRAHEPHLHASRFGSSELFICFLIVAPLLILFLLSSSTRLLLCCIHLSFLLVLYL